MYSEKRKLDDALADDEFFQRLSALTINGDASKLGIDDLLAASVRLARPNASSHFNNYSFLPTVSFVNNLVSIRNSERLAKADGRLSAAALLLSFVSLVVALFESLKEWVL